MDFITIDRARAHCKADSADDAMLTIYGNAAEKACANLVNRAVFVDQEALETAQTTAYADMSAANAAYATAVDDANALTGSDKTSAMQKANADLFKAQATYLGIVNGMVVTEDFIAAVLLVLGHLYRNREDVVTGQAAAAVQIPMGAQALLAPLRNVGML